MARLAHALPVDRSGPARFAAEHDVLGDAEVGQQVDLLVHRADARGLRLARRREVHELAVEPNLAGIQSKRAGQRLDQRRLAGAVLSHERVDLAGKHAKADVVERRLGLEAHGGSQHLDDRPTGVVHLLILP